MYYFTLLQTALNFYIIRADLLEKSRVVKQNEGDRNFHIFYQLLSDGFDKDLRLLMGLQQKANEYRFLNQGGKTIDPEIDDVQGAADTVVSHNKYSIPMLR